MQNTDPPSPWRRVKIWDLPTRLFHWSLVLLVFASWLTNRLNLMDLHFLSGYTVMGLLIFRLIWGVLGSETARFRDFLKSPRDAIGHLRHLFVREPDQEIGHNAAGGWMVLGLLSLLVVQVGTGLCSNDDILVEGPLAKYVGKDMSDRIGTIHAVNFKLIELAVLAHICAVLAYAVFKGQNLVGPMITGTKRLPVSARPPNMASPMLAAVAIASAVVLATLAATRL